MPLTIELPYIIRVSNHGGRQLDGTEGTADALGPVCRAVEAWNRGNPLGQRCEVYVDGAVRRGKDVFRALALGARAVFVGRPFLFGLAVGGEDGARRVLDCLREELLSTMQLAGVQNCGEITPAHVTKKSTIAGSEREAQRGRL